MSLVTSKVSSLNSVIASHSSSRATARAAVEKAWNQQEGGASFLSLELGTELSASQVKGLPASAKRAMAEINDAAEGYGYGEARAQSFTADGQKFYVISGIQDDMVNQLFVFDTK